MPPGTRVPRSGTNRAVAALLATLWLGGGLGGVLAAVTRHRVLGFVVGPLAIGYGVLWLRVAVTGQRLRWPVRPP